MLKIDGHDLDYFKLAGWPAGEFLWEDNSPRTIHVPGGVTLRLNGAAYRVTLAAGGRLQVGAKGKATIVDSPERVAFCSVESGGHVGHVAGIGVLEVHKGATVGSAVNCGILSFGGRITDVADCTIRVATGGGRVHHAARVASQTAFAEVWWEEAWDLSLELDKVFAPYEGDLGDLGPWGIEDRDFYAYIPLEEAGYGNVYTGSICVSLEPPEGSCPKGTTLCRVLPDLSALNSESALSPVTSIVVPNVFVQEDMYPESSDSADPSCPNVPGLPPAVRVRSYWTDRDQLVRAVHTNSGFVLESSQRYLEGPVPRPGFVVRLGPYATQLFEKAKGSSDKARWELDDMLVVGSRWTPEQEYSRSQFMDKIRNLLPMWVKETWVREA